MKTYIAQRTIDHDNQIYAAGELLELDDKTAGPLLAAAAVIESETDANASDGENPEPESASEDEGASKKTAKKAK